MKSFCLVAAFVLLASLPARAAEPAIGVGAHGYDWLIGNWTCTNAMRASIGGPATQTVTVSRSNNGGLAVRVSGVGFERSGYIAFDPATKTWWRPFAYPNGNYYVESTNQTGSRTQWSGPYTNVASGKTFMVRDTFTIASPTKYRDIGEYQSGSSWTTGYDGTCKKT